MRRQAREKDGIMEESSAGAVTTDPEEGPHRHINLFTDIQHGVSFKKSCKVYYYAALLVTVQLHVVGMYL